MKKGERALVHFNKHMKINANGKQMLQFQISRAFKLNVLERGILRVLGYYHPFFKGVNLFIISNFLFSNNKQVIAEIIIVCFLYIGEFAAF